MALARLFLFFLPFATGRTPVVVVLVCFSSDRAPVVVALACFSSDGAPVVVAPAWCPRWMDVSRKSVHSTVRSWNVTLSMRAC